MVFVSEIEMMIQDKDEVEQAQPMPHSCDNLNLFADLNNTLM